MPRTRLLKPEFFLDEEMAKMSPIARLMFQALMPVVDREGRIEDRPARIKVVTLPYDTMDPNAVLQELTDAGFLVRYEAQGKRVVQVRSFLKHQKPHKDEQRSVLPPAEPGGCPGIATKSPGIATAEPGQSPEGATKLHATRALVLDPSSRSRARTPLTPPGGAGLDFQ